MTILPKTKKSHVKEHRELREHRDHREHRELRPDRRLLVSSSTGSPAHHPGHLDRQKHIPIGLLNNPIVGGIPAVSNSSSGLHHLPKSFGGAKKVSGTVGPRKVSTVTNSASPHHEHAHLPTSSNSHSSKGHVKRRTTGQEEEPLNSDDEYGTGFRDDELEATFVERMKTVRGFIVKEVKGDGACMFRAVADQIYGDEEMHHDVRRLCMDYVAKNRDHFSQFITEDFNEYLTRKRLDDVHGNHVELQAMSEIFLRPIEVYEYHTDPINTFHPISREANQGLENPPIRLSYHGSVHYNSVVDPFAPTIGVGLGLPEYKPGLADRNLLKEASMASERQHIEEAMLKDKMQMTDWERTEDELQRQIANESYMEYLRHIESLASPDRRAPAQNSNNNQQYHHKSRVEERQTQHQQQHGGQHGQHGQSRKESHPVRQSPPRGVVNLLDPQQQLKLNFAASNAPVKLLSLGTKRGASSPNLPSTSSRDEDFGPFVPFAKIHRNEYTSSSMPNIDSNFGASLAGPSSLMKPSTSSLNLKLDHHHLLQKPSTSSSQAKQDHLEQHKFNSNEEKATTSKEAEETPRIGLYEELLASSAVYGESTEDETALLAQVLAMSQQEFLDSVKNSPRHNDN